MEATPSLASLKYPAEEPLDHLSLAETSSGDSGYNTTEETKRVLFPSNIVCDACSDCSEQSESDECGTCTAKRPLGQGDEPVECLPFIRGQRCYTRCQVRRHASRSSVWIVAGNTIYDVTKYLDTHPAGADCILRKAGGAADCTMDLQFHSRRGQDRWKKLEIGKLVECGQQLPSTDTQWWMFWAR